MVLVSIISIESKIKETRAGEGVNQKYSVGEKNICKLIAPFKGAS
jgi:hypothetical protein